MVNNGYDRAMALEAVASGAADLVAFGRPFIGNPDLGRRLRDDLPWAPSDRKTYYGGSAGGYTDYAAFGAPVPGNAEGGAGSAGGAAASA
jgi:N-ethylmaleimide reductase